MRLLLVGLLSAPLVYADSADLLTVFNASTADNPTLQAAQAAQNAASADLDGAAADLKPTLALSGSASVSENFLPNVPQNAGGESAQISGGLNARLPLLAPSVDAAIDLKTASLSVAELDRSEALAQLSLDVATAYFGVLSAQSQLDAAQAQLSAVERQLDRAQQRLEVGLGTRVDVDRTQASFDLTAVNVIRAQDGVAKAKDDLEALTGQRFESLKDLRAGYQAAPYGDSLANVIDTTLRQATPVKQLRLGAELAQAGLDSATAAGAISLDAVASVSNGKNLSSGTTSRGASIGLNLSMPLITGGKVEAGMANAQAQLEEVQAELRATERTLISAARGLYRSLATQAKTVTARAQAIKSAETAVEATESAYEVGSGDIIDVLNAQSDLFAARSDYQIALYDHATLTLELEKLQGELDAADLTALNQLLAP